jgi:hypothetical protein
VEEGGVEVVDVDPVEGRLVADFVGRNKTAHRVGAVAKLAWEQRSYGAKIGR